MAFYTIQKGSSEEREQVKNSICGLEYLSKETQDMIITAWISSWKSSKFERLDQIPGFSFSSYKLIDHVNDVVHFGVTLAEGAGKKWNTNINWEDLIQMLILHDIDKPLLLVKKDNDILKTEAAKQFQHGVLGAILLKEIGFSENIISAVASHATDNTFHVTTVEAYILHYSDLFSADQILLTSGKTPFYQRFTLK